MKNIDCYKGISTILVYHQSLMVEIPLWQPVLFLHVKWSFVVLAVPSDDGQ
jgi:hypothetical protein